MTAKEMFEELGYKYQQRDNDVLLSKKYYVPQEDGDVFSFDYKEEISFFKNSEFINDGIHLSKRKSLVNKNDYNEVDFIISINLYKAIQKQIEELGWESDKNE